MVASPLHATLSFRDPFHDVALMIDHECAGREANCLDMLGVAFTMRACETAQGF
jgi:hypothetical protein